MCYNQRELHKKGTCILHYNVHVYQEQKKKTILTCSVHYTNIIKPLPIAICSSYHTFMNKLPQLYIFFCTQEDSQRYK